MEKYMKYWQIDCFAKHLAKHKRLNRVFRTKTNELLFVFSDQTYIIDITPSDSLIVPALHAYENEQFATPFDVIIAKRLTNSQLVLAETLGQDKILSLEFVKHSSYKEECTKLVIELTGRYTNAIILDENGVILESIKRIENSVRKIANGEIYTAPPPPKNPPVLEPCENLLETLTEMYANRQNRELTAKKQIAVAQIDKKLEALTQTLKSLPTPEALENESKQLFLEANLLLNSLDQVPKWAKSVTLSDYEGVPIVINLEGQPSAQIEANRRFNRAKRTKAKAKGVHKELSNINERIEFYKRLKLWADQAKNSAELQTITPQKKLAKKEKTKDDSVEHFVVGGYKVLAGRNERGNISVLKNAKANDIWIHLKDTPSAHLIISNPKNISDQTILQVATLCAKLTLSQKGKFLVDYTTRRFVKVIHGAFVNYTNYKTVTVNLE